MNKLLLAVTLLGAGASWAQTVTWVSGVGDDFNPCSRTAPCLTLSRAVEATQSGGAVHVLDPGDFAADAGADAGTVLPGLFPSLTITKAITVEGGKLRGRLSDDLPATEVQGVVISAGPDDVVVLRNLSISAAQSGTRGIVFKAGKALYLERVTVNGFSFDGVSFQPATAALLSVTDSVFANNGAGGVSVSPGALSSAVLINSQFKSNRVGLSLGGNVSAVISGGSFSGNADAGAALGASGGPVNANFEGATVFGNGTGVLMESAASNVTGRFASSTVMGNGTRSILRGASQLFSFGTNRWQGGVCARTSVEPTSNNLVAGQPFSFPLQLANGLGSISVTRVDGGLPPGLSVDAGVLTGTPSLKGTYVFENRLGDSQGCMTGATSWSFDVACPSQSLSPAAPPAGTTGALYPATTFVLSNAVGAAQVSVTGALPIGMNATGATLSGRPTEVGTFPLMVSAQDTASCGVAQTLSLVIAAGPGFQPTSLGLSASAASVEYGQGFSLTGSLDAGAGTLTGSIDFSDDAGVIGSAMLTGRAATVPLVAGAVGARTFTAVYSGDTTFGGSRSGPVTVTVVPASTRLSLQASSSTVALNTQLGFGAQVSSDGGVPTGAVAFFVDGADAGQFGLDGGAAGFATAFTTAGSHQVTASYGGSTNFAASAGASVSVTVTSGSGGGAGGGTAGGSGGGTAGGSGGGVAGGAGGGVAGGGGTAGSGGGGTGGGTSGGSGCGCQSSDGAPLMLLAFAGLALLRRRRFVA